MLGAQNPTRILNPGYEQMPVPTPAPVLEPPTSQLTGLRKLDMLDSTAVTVGTTITPLIPISTGKVIDLEVKVRSLGSGGTYVALGSGSQREWRLVAGDYFQYPIPKGYYMDSKEITAISDAAGAVVEVFACMV